MNNYLREPVNGFTHLAGAILSFIGLLALVIKTALQGHSTIALTAVIIFGISMILLYAASATYHLVVSSDKVISFLRRLDHAMIFLLIAGSYTPCLLYTSTRADDNHAPPVTSVPEGKDAIRHRSKGCQA